MSGAPELCGRTGYDAKARGAVSVQDSKLDELSNVGVCEKSGGAVKQVAMLLLGRSM